MIGRLLELFGGLPAPLFVLVAFGLAFAESAVLLDLVVPGEAATVLVGAAGRHGETPAVTLVLAVAAGAVLGDSVSFWLGRRFGLGVVRRWSFTRRRLLPAIERANHYFDRRGGFAVFAARWIGALRAIVPAVAGAAHMSYARFIAWDVVAALTWSATLVSVGWFVGEPAAAIVDRLGGWITLAVPVALLVWWLLHRRGATHSRRRPTPLRA